MPASQVPQDPKVPPCLQIPPAPHNLFAPPTPSKGKKVPIPKKPRVNLSSISHDRHTNYTGDLPLKSLDDSRHLFTSFLSSPPTFKDACEDAGIIEKLIKDSESLANEAMKDPEFVKYGLTFDEAQAIACYTVEIKKEE